MQDATWLRRRCIFVTANHSGQGILLHPDGGNHFELNQAGALIWQQLSQPRQLLDLQAVLFENAGISPRDVRAFLSGLIQAGLVEVAAEPQRAESQNWAA